MRSVKKFSSASLLRVALSSKTTSQIKYFLFPFILYSRKGVSGEHSFLYMTLRSFGSFKEKIFPLSLLKVRSIRSLLIRSLKKKRSLIRSIFGGLLLLESQHTIHVNKKIKGTFKISRFMINDFFDK